MKKRFVPRRYFIAIGLPKAVLDEAKRVQKQLNKKSDK